MWLFKTSPGNTKTNLSIMLYRNTPTGKRDAASTRSISSANDDEMLENELESIFSAGKVAMKSIFKEDDSSQSQNKVGTLDDAHDKVIS